LLSEYVIYYLVDRKTFAIANGPLVTPNPRVVYLNWVGRELYTSTDEFGNTTPYEDKLYIANNGIVYVWTGSELKSVGVDGLKAYYNNNEISSINITDTITSGDDYDSYIPSNIVINNLNSRIADLERRIFTLENSSSNNPSQGEVSNGSTEIEDPTTDPGTTVTP